MDAAPLLLLGSNADRGMRPRPPTLNAFGMCRDRSTHAAPMCWCSLLPAAAGVGAGCACSMRHRPFTTSQRAAGGWEPAHGGFCSTRKPVCTTHSCTQMRLLCSACASCDPGATQCRAMLCNKHGSGAGRPHHRDAAVAGCAPVPLDLDLREFSPRGQTRKAGTSEQSGSGAAVYLPCTATAAPQAHRCGKRGERAAVPRQPWPSHWDTCICAAPSLA